jgi:hypothetical protein
MSVKAESISESIMNQRIFLTCMTIWTLGNGEKGDGETEESVRVGSKIESGWMRAHLSAITLTRCK